MSSPEHVNLKLTRYFQVIEKMEDKNVFLSLSIMLLSKMEYLAFCSRESCQDTLRLFVQTLQEDINLVYRMIFAFCYSIRREISPSSKQTGSFSVGERLPFESTARKLSLFPERQTSMLRS